jgi:hypothetical protein
MIEAATILAAISPAQEARLMEVGGKLAQLLPLFGVAAYTQLLIFLFKNAWGVLAAGVFLLLFAGAYPFGLPGDDDSKDKLNLGVAFVHTNIGGNLRTFIAAGGLLLIAGAIVMIIKTT